MVLHEGRRDVGVVLGHLDLVHLLEAVQDICGELQLLNLVLVEGYAVLGHEGFDLCDGVSGADELFVGLADASHVVDAGEDVLALLLALALLLDLEGLLLDPVDDILAVGDEAGAVLLEVERALDALGELVDCLLEGG